MIELLAEAMRIYRRRWRDFLFMSSVIYVPVTALFILTLTIEYPVYSVLLTLLLALGTPAFAGAIASAVCQHYAFNRVDVGAAYRRAQWRYISLLGVVLITWVITVVGFTFFWIVIPLVLAVAFRVYWSVATQASILEGHKMMSALRRSYRLVRGIWWRAFAASLLFELMGVRSGVGRRWAGDAGGLGFRRKQRGGDSHVDRSPGRWCDGSTIDRYLLHPALLRPKGKTGRIDRGDDSSGIGTLATGRAVRSRCWIGRGNMADMEEGGSRVKTGRLGGRGPGT